MVAVHRRLPAHRRLRLRDRRGSIGALLYAVARQGITLAGWDPPWFQALLGVLLLVALVANGVVRRRLKAVPRS